MHPSAVSRRPNHLWEKSRGKSDDFPVFSRTDVMHLTRFTDLSLRVLMYLTYRNRTVLVTVNELAQRFEWSRNHIVKVAHFLSTKGWIISHRGRTGGLQLAKDPSEYRLGDLIRELEGSQPMLDCENPPCNLSGGCQIRRIVDEAVEAFYEVLNRYTLESITSVPEAQAVITLLNEMPVGRQPCGDEAGMPGSMLIKSLDRDEPFGGEHAEAGSEPEF